MAQKSRKTQSDEVKRATLQMHRNDAENRIRAQIDKGEQLLHLQIRNESDLDRARAEKKRWSDYNAELLRRIVDTDDLVKDYYPGVGFAVLGPVPFNRKAEEFYSRVRDKINCLESILTRLELIPESPEFSQAVRQAQTDGPETSSQIFVVHGHDEEAKQSVARCIEKLGLQAIILHEQPNQGRTIIEKFEDYAGVGFAAVLLTPDDVGASKDDMDKVRPRARQNVILELGFFIGRLGRQRVCALHKGEVEIPSDFSGVLWVPMDPNGAWRFTLAREMKAAGFDADLNKLI